MERYRCMPVSWVTTTQFYCNKISFICRMPDNKFKFESYEMIKSSNHIRNKKKIPKIVEKIIE